MTVMNIEKLIAILLSLLILGQAWLVSRRVGTWIFPASILGLFWFIYTFIPLVLVFSAPIEPMAIVFILICCLAFSLSSLVFNWQDLYRVHLNSETIFRYDTNYIKYTFIAFTFIIIFCVVFNWKLQGFKYHDIIFHLFDTARKYITARARGEVEKNIVSQVGLVLTYSAAVLGGLVYGSKGKGNAGILTMGLAMFPSALLMLIEGNKGTLFLAISLFWGATLLCKINSRDLRIFKGVSGAKVIFIFGVVMSMIIYAFSARIGYAGLDNEAMNKKIIWYILSYSCGHLYAFSDWFSWALGKSSISEYSDAFNGNGFYTFMGLFRLMGDDRVIVPGTYAEYFVYKDLLQSNIYTIFRGLVIDFGFVGAVFFWALIGLISHVLFRYILSGRLYAISATLFIYLIGFFYTSFMISLLIWNSVFASFAITCLVLMGNDWMCRRD